MSTSNYGARIEIYNPALWDIIRKYKELGAFEEDKSSSCDRYICVTPDRSGGDSSPVFIFKDSSGAYYQTHMPRDIRDVTPCLLISLCKEFRMPKKLFIEMKDSVMGALEHIEHSYDHVFWQVSYSAVGGDYDPTSGLISRVCRLSYNRFTDVSEYSEKTVCDGFTDDDYYGTRRYSDYDAFDWEEFVASQYRDTVIHFYPTAESTPISELLLPIRCLNILRRAGIKTVGELAEKSDGELLGLPRMTEDYLEQIRRRLEEMLDK
ncbi:MAG: hypothetical protein IJ072_00125 [Oscillospiraceae bacterium]|nr:hypothetical protein [Oscillospiraceae bacterium]